MRQRLLRTAWIIALLAVLGCPLVAVAEPVYIGTFAEPFTTVFARGELSYPGEIDWYRFDVVGDAATVRLQAEELGSDIGLRVLLFEQDETYIDSAQNEVLMSSLMPGTYKLRIDSPDSAVQSYSLVMYNGVEMESNDGVVESNALGELKGPTRLAATLLPAGDADFFSFEVSQNGLPKDANALVIETSGLTSEDTAITLYQYSDADGRYLPILFDDDSGEGVWSRLLVRPEPGDRFVLRAEETYYPLAGIDDYELAITPITLIMDAEPNNTSTQAIDLNTLSPAGALGWADGMLSSGDAIDFYKITLSASALLQIATVPQSDAGDYDTLLTLYSASGDRLLENDDSGNVPWSRIAMGLDAGEYFIAVESNAAETAVVPYRLNVSALGMVLVDEAEPNDSDESAETIPWTGEEALMVNASIGVDGDVDSFRLVLEADARLVIETGPIAGSTEEFDTTLSIYDEDLWEIASNDDANGTWSQIEETLSAGTYYIVVESFFGDESFAYSLLITSSNSAP